MGLVRERALGACQVNLDAASKLCLSHDCHFRLFVRKKKLSAIPDAKYKLNTGQGKTIQQISRATSATKYTIFSPYSVRLINMSARLKCAFRSQLGMTPAGVRTCACTRRHLIDCA
jgi:hypothetical protein